MEKTRELSMFQVKTRVREKMDFFGLSDKHLFVTAYKRIGGIVLSQNGISSAFFLT